MTLQNLVCIHFISRFTFVSTAGIVHFGYDCCSSFLQPETPLEHCEWLNKLSMQVWLNYINPKLSSRFASIVEVAILISITFKDQILFFLFFHISIHMIVMIEKQEKKFNC